MTGNDSAHPEVYSDLQRYVRCKTYDHPPVMGANGAPSNQRTPPSQRRKVIRSLGRVSTEKNRRSICQITLIGAEVGLRFCHCHILQAKTDCNFSRVSLGSSTLHHSAFEIIVRSLSICTRSMPCCSARMTWWEIEGHLIWNGPHMNTMTND